MKQVCHSIARGEADAESDIDTVFVRPVGVDESDEAWSASVEQWRSRIRRISGNPVEILEVGSEEIRARLSSRRAVWRDIRRGRESFPTDDPSTNSQRSTMDREARTRNVSVAQKCVTVARRVVSSAPRQ